MRASTLSKKEVADLDETKRKEFRKGGFALMRERDKKWARLRDYNGSEVIMDWGISDNQLFKLIVDGKSIVLNAEQFRKYLRWV